MHPAILDLLQRQQREGFADLGGSIVAATIPLHDRLINELIAKLLPPGGKIREIQIQSHDANRLTAKVRITGSSLLPAIPVTLSIERQPEFPADPVLGLKLSQSSGFVAMAASALPSMVALPPGITIEGDRIRIDIRRVLADRGFEQLIQYVTDLRVNTRQGAVVVDIRTEIGARPAGV